MPRYVLRPVDPQDPRPNFADEDVLLTAARAASKGLTEWVAGKALPFDDAHVEFAVVMALRTAGLDAFRMGVVLASAFNWPVDYALVRTLDAVVEALPSALKIVTGKWVVRTGIRFPAQEGDTIEYLDDDGRSFVAVVTGVLGVQARAFVSRLIDGEPEPQPVSIAAEAVTANVTQGRYQTERPALGLRYLNAPALAAQAEAERASSPAAAAAPPKTSHPLADLPDFDPPPAVA